MISKPRKLVAGGARGPGKAAVSEHPLQLRAAYSVCRHIARSAAKNFYYGFLVLPARKRNALSAVYAFMRRADDISDDPSIPVEQRREKLDDWMNGLRRVVDGERTDDPVLLALADSQKRFNIPLELLEKLVQGTAMDVPDAPTTRRRSACNTRPSISSTITAITWRRSLAWCASASSAIAIRAPKSWRSKPEWPSSSPTSCAT